MIQIDEHIINIMDDNNYTKKFHYIMNNNNKILQFIIKKCFKLRYVLPILILKVDKNDFSKFDNIYFKKSGYYYFFINRLANSEYIYNGKIIYSKYKFSIISYSYTYKKEFLGLYSKTRLQFMQKNINVLVKANDDIIYKTHPIEKKIHIWISKL